MDSTEARELKLGTTFSSQHNAFHTLKYDFKPASVDLNKEATVEVGTNNQVQVTVPHLDGAGVPKTVFKGNQKKYTKECVLIVDRNTGEITLERLTNNISVKKTRSESALKQNGQLGVGGGLGPSSTGAGPSGAPMKINENSTQRTVSKTKVSTGVRKTNNPITGFIHKHSPNQMSDYPHHKSPQSAPAWNANNGQSTLPSIPIIDDDVEPLGHHIQPNHHTTTTNHHTHSNGNNNHHPHNNYHQQQQQPLQHQPPPVTQMSSGVAAATDLMSSSDSSSDTSYSSDSDSSHHSGPTTTNNHVNSVKPPTNLLKEDLCLSDSNSDSD